MRVREYELTEAKNKYSAVDLAAATSHTLNKNFYESIEDIKSVATSHGYNVTNINTKIPNSVSRKIIDSMNKMTGGDFELTIKDETLFNSLKPQNILVDSLKKIKGFSRKQSISVSMLIAIIEKLGYKNRKRVQQELVDRAISTISSTLVPLDDVIEIFQEITRIKLSTNFKDVLFPPAPTAPDVFLNVDNLMKSNGMTMKSALEQALKIIEDDIFNDASSLEKIGIAVLAAKGKLSI